MKYSLEIINNILNSSESRKELLYYCNFLKDKYKETLEGKYRIKYNDLYSLLFVSLSNDKKVDFFNSFASSLDIKTIKVNKNGNKIKLYKF
jgi:hypothetical protein